MEPHDIAIREHLNNAYHKPNTYAQAQEWMAKNPQVYAEFKRFAFEAVMMGAKRISADMVAHRVRWESYIIRGDKTVYKVNNTAVTYMAKRFIEENPHLYDLFEFRSSPNKDV